MQPTLKICTINTFTIPTPSQNNGGVTLTSFPPFKAMQRPMFPTPSFARNSSAWPRAMYPPPRRVHGSRSEEHTSELQSRGHLVCRLLLEKKKQCTSNENTGPMSNRHWLYTLKSY